ncbi:MAG: hypothetical protein ABF274_04505 [Nonlabens sp.]|uniref:hypothetical protein n=1 Tax=Nonlabens sp. TaxID=1888209 RepID=UPI0032194F7B
MKLSLSILLGLLLTTCNAQVNDLTISQYQQIKFGNYLLTDIINTRGDAALINSYFSQSFTISTYEEPSHTILFDSSDINLVFKDGNVDINNTINNYQLTNLRLTNNAVSIFINGSNVRVGDNISILGNVNSMNDPSNRQKKIVFRLGSEVIRISYNRNTNIITLIEYEYFN